jgi:hypothetical protein
VKPGGTSLDGVVFSGTLDGGDGRQDVSPGQSTPQSLVLRAAAHALARPRASLQGGGGAALAGNAAGLGWRPYLLILLSPVMPERYRIAPGRSR